MADHVVPHFQNDPGVAVIAWHNLPVAPAPGPLAGLQALERLLHQLGELREAEGVAAGGQAIGQLGAYEAIWHTDMSYIPEPPMASALIQTLLLVPLLGYGSYEFSTLAMDRYFPQLILLVVKQLYVKKVRIQK